MSSQCKSVTGSGPCKQGKLYTRSPVQVSKHLDCNASSSPGPSSSMNPAGDSPGGLKRRNALDATKVGLLQGMQRGRHTRSSLPSARGTATYLAAGAWGWAAAGPQGTVPGPGEPPWLSSSSARCRSRSTGQPPGCRSAPGTGSRGASAACRRPSRGSTPLRAQGCLAGPAAGPGDTPLPWWGAHSLLWLRGTTLPFFF